jgi:hypothetical protein
MCGGFPSSSTQGPRPPRMSEPTPSATYYMNVEHDPPKPRPWKLTPRKAKKRKARCK